MKKSKKLGLQSLALVLMSLVLVAGVAFGMTGAWFADSVADSDNSIVMGNGVAATMSVAFEKDWAMPGETVDLTGSVAAAAKSSEFRMRVKAKVTGAEEGKIVLTKITIGTEEVTADATGADYTYLTTTLKDGASKNIAASVEFVGSALTNADDAKTITVELTIEVIQAANTSYNAEKGGWVDNAGNLIALTEGEMTATATLNGEVR